MSSEFAIQAEGLGKCYRIYQQPADRLKQAAYGVAAALLPPAAPYWRKKQQACGRDFWALQSINLNIARGETVGIIGRNGSGKSTLLQLLCGTIQPTTGSVTTHGRIGALLELGAGFNPEFSGRENVFLNAQLLGLTKKQVVERFDSIREFADIGDFIDQPVKTYSSGMYVRLAFAIIAHIDADVLVIDEALAVGDAYFTQKCMRFLHNFMRTGTVLFVSHDIASVKALAERSIWLDGGRIRMIGNTRDIADSYLAALYAGDSSSQPSPPSLPPDAPPRQDATRSPERRLQPVPDFRVGELKRLDLINCLQTAPFDMHANRFGDGKASIINVRLLDSSEQTLLAIEGGERVILEMTTQAHASLSSPIVGFFLRNRLGQNVFGDNTYLQTAQKEIHCVPNSTLIARFVFIMPFLPPGDYAFSVAIASGSNHSHEQHQWLHDALLLKSLSSAVHADVLGIPMIDITLETI